LDALIYDAIRTPRGKGRSTGSLYEVKPVRLLADLLIALQERNGFDTAAVDDIAIGCVTPVGDQGANIAKTAALLADWDEQVSGFQLNRFCASGLEAVNLGAAKIGAGFEQLVVAGGVESMSRVPMASDGGPWAMDPETNLHTHFAPQGIGADLIATLEGFDRMAVDRFAAASHKKAAAAWEAGYFSGSVIPVRDRNGLCILERDETIRPDTSTESLAALKPAFATMGGFGFDATALRKYNWVDAINHVHTPGNSSGIVDGAALVLLGTPAMGERFGMKPRARVVACAVTSTDPTIMLTGPAPAARKVLRQAGLTADDIDLFEVNEAFASVVMKFQKELGVEDDRVNVNGGAIAMGHPLGATGAIILGTLVDALEQRGLKRGMATLCIGGGMGIATIVETL
jgi:acetyl-CoA C-acetyltransferase